MGRFKRSAATSLGDWDVESIEPGPLTATLVTWFSLVGTGVTIVLWALWLRNIEAGWYAVFEVMAGTALVVPMRWLWWRVTAWCEITAMVMSIFLFYSFEKADWVLPFYQTFGYSGGLYELLGGLGLPEAYIDEYAIRFFLSAMVSTMVWVVVAYVGPFVQDFLCWLDQRVSSLFNVILGSVFRFKRIRIKHLGMKHLGLRPNIPHLVKFYAQVRPIGVWNFIANQAGIKPTGVAKQQIACAALGTICIYSLILATNGYIPYGGLFVSVCAVVVAVTAYLVYRINRTIDWGLERGEAQAVDVV